MLFHRSLPISRKGKERYEQKRKTLMEKMVGRRKKLGKRKWRKTKGEKKRWQGSLIGNTIGFIWIPQ